MNPRAQGADIEEEVRTVTASAEVERSGWPRRISLKASGGEMQRRQFGEKEEL